MRAISQDRQAKALGRPRRFAAANHPNLAFWLSFALLNGLLFLPLYLFNQQASSFLPVPDPAGQSVPAVFRQLALWRNNLDIFRLSLEVTLLAALWVHARWLWRGRRPRLYRALFMLCYAAALAYAIYESVFLSLYQVDPVFYAQVRMVLDGAPFVVRQLQWPWTVYAAGVGLLVAATLAIWRLVRTVVGGAPPERLSRGTRVAMAALALWAVLPALAWGLPLASPKSAVNSLAAKLHENLAESLDLRRRIAAFDSETPQRVYSYASYKLLQRPDIYLIFVESYGSVLYHRADWQLAYQQLLGDLEQDLAAAGWHAATALSESPTWGGGSWMAYTSALFGLRIDTHAQYLALLDEYQDTAYPDLGRYLQSQGYHSAFVTAISTELREGQPPPYQDFYGVDDWVDFDRLGYQGPRYGWGLAPPDQYVLWQVDSELAATATQPTFLFYITQNSHYPWVPQPELVEDWRALNRPAENPTAPLPDQIPQPIKRRNYFNAVEYQLRFLTDFILRSGHDNAIYVLVGDHQPQQVSRRDDGFATPIHIVSRDADLVRFFGDYGFVEGLSLDKIEPAMRHEGFYSLFVRSLVASYGQGGKVLPAYLPDGIAADVDPVDDQYPTRRQGHDSN